MRPALESVGLLEASFGGFGALAIAQFVYSVLFFLVAYFVALNPEKLTQRLGKYLCPALIVLIFVLFLGILFHPLGEAAAPGSAYAHGAFATGFIEGYQTMDTIAALNFGLVIAMNIRAFGIKSEGAVVKETVLAGCDCRLRFLCGLRRARLYRRAGGGRLFGHGKRRADPHARRRRPFRAGGHRAYGPYFLHRLS